MCHVVHGCFQKVDERAESENLSLTNFKLVEIQILHDSVQITTALSNPRRMHDTIFEEERKKEIIPGPRIPIPFFPDVAKTPSFKGRLDFVGASRLFNGQSHYYYDIPTPRDERRRIKRRVSPLRRKTSLYQTERRRKAPKRRLLSLVSLLLLLFSPSAQSHHLKRIERKRGLKSPGLKNPRPPPPPSAPRSPLFFRGTKRGKKSSASVQRRSPLSLSSMVDMSNRRTGGTGRRGERRGGSRRDAENVEEEEEGGTARCHRRHKA